MISRYLFLLVYLGIFIGGLSAQRNETCTRRETCVQVPDATSNFLQCVGLPSTDTGADHLRRLKGILEATMDVYTFMKSSMTSGPILSLESILKLDFGADPLQNEDLVKLWVEVNMKPLLKSITKQFLSCLSTKNFSCSTYQTIVEELSHHYSEMDPFRQKWIYTFFMYPFLSGRGVAGCVNPSESNQEWLMKNFGAFSVMARMKDFSELNIAFSGLEVLHLLSPAQKAELLLSPEVASLGNGTLALVFHSLLTGGSGPPPTDGPGFDYNWTSPEYPTPYPLQPSYNPHPPSPHERLKQIVNGLMMTFKPIGSFVQGFVSFTHERNVSEMRSTTLTQFLLNWTLAELADVYRQPNASVAPEEPQFDVSNVQDWYEHIVKPLLRRFLPDEELLMHQNITHAFHHVFHLDNGMDDETPNEIQDVCSITLDKSPCGLTDAVKNVAHVLHCSAINNLTMSEAVVMKLVLELAHRLNSLIQELSTVNFMELASEVQQIFSDSNPPSLTQEHLNDPEFIKLWFQVKLLPLLPDINPELLSCLSTKNFSCPVYQTLVAALSEQMSFMDADLMYSHNIYAHFIYPFLLHNNTSDPRCVASANQSAEWLNANFGFFSIFAPITDFYTLNPNFSGLEALPLLTPKQTAELLLLPLPTPPEKDVVINQVFDFLTESPEVRKYPEVLKFLVKLAEEIKLPCDVYKQIFDRLYAAIPSLPPEMEPVTWASIEDLMNIAPTECVPANFTCPVTLLNSTNICRGVNSSDLQSYLNTFMSVPCNFPLENYACAQLDNFTASQLVSLLKCDLPGDSKHSKMLWKMVLTKFSSVLNPALDMLADMSMPVIPSAPQVLDVIGEIRLLMLTNEELRDTGVISLWFSHRLSNFLPFASGMFLRCLSSRDLNCQSYQAILQAFIQQFGRMSSEQQHMVLEDFILRFLMQTQSNFSCVSTSNNTAQWLRENLGPFSEFLTLQQLLHLNPQFNPMEVLTVLTPKQSAELLFLMLPSLPDKDVIINALFDYLTEFPEERKFTEFLTNLTMLSQPGNLSCSSYKTLFSRLDLALRTVPLVMMSSITHTKMVLSQHLPPDCIIYSGECNVTMANETICARVNSTAFELQLASGKTSKDLCNFGVEEVACASLSDLAAEQLAMILKCNRSSNSSGSRAIWKLLLSKASHVLDTALDLLTNTTLDPSNPSGSMILDAIRELRLDTVSTATLNDPDFIQTWFGHRLRPFLPAVSPDFLSCLTTNNLTCTSFRQIVQILSHLQPQMTLARQVTVYTHLIRIFLTRENSTDPACSSDITNSGEWLQKNLGGFASLVSFQDIQMIYSNFSVTEALPLLTVKQLAEVSATPGQLTSAEQVNMVMKYVPDQALPAFFDDFSPVIKADQNAFPDVVRSTMLQVVFDRANLTSPSVDDSVVSVWLRDRIPPLLVNLLPVQVTPYFQILEGRSCNIEQQGLENLNKAIATLREETQNQVYDHIVQMLKGPVPLRCYGDNYNNSFYVFLERSFMGFQFPNLTTFLLLMPHDRMQQLLNSMPPSDLGNFLRRPHVVDNDAQLCVLYRNYRQTPLFLETESLPETVRRPTLPCVWPMALSSTQKSEVNAWFDRRLKDYLPFLTKSLISPSVTYNTSCLAFQKLVLVLGVHNYTGADFVRSDVYNSIRTYLTAASSASTPRCYVSSDPELNSTAWFAEYIGPFMPFLTLEDLQTFGSQQVIQVFTVNPLNIALLNHSVLPVNLTNYYTELIYQENSNFNPLLLPLLCRCVAPGPAFSQLSANESMIVLKNLTSLCGELDPQVTAALAGNFGNKIDATAIAALGNESVGLSVSQIRSINPQVIISSLSILGSVMGWSEGQARAIIQILTSSGVMQINSASSLINLGTLIMGVPTRLFRQISGFQLLTASRDFSLLQNLMSGPQIIQQIFVTQIISVNSNSERVIENIPDELATEIPRRLLTGFSNNLTVIKTLNKKNWKRQQAELFFEVIGAESSTAQLGSPNNLSSTVLQGFTCTGVRTFQNVQIKKLVRACRRQRSNKVTLVETQLTCMYNYIRGDSDVTAFDQYPQDLLLYYDYSLVPLASCRSYFEQLSDADFSVFSSVLSYKRTALFSNARSCLGITNTSLTADNILVLGNMCCYLDGSYIENSDPSILEKLNGCADLTDTQVAAIQTLLMSGKTKYGVPSTWTLQTLKGLGMLPLYLTSTFYDNFDKKTKRSFLKYFLQVLRRNGVERNKRRNLKREIRLSIRNLSKRAAVTDCTVGFIDHVTISDETFPFDYDDVNQFTNCLSSTVVSDNLEAIVQKVDQVEYLKIVLNKLQEAYNATSIIPEDQVQLLGPASRVATVEDINTWVITQLDTLAALMNSSNGEWDPSLAKAVISKYLSTGGNSLGSAELNTIGGQNLCSLDTDVLKNISQQSLRDADALDISNCTTEKKKELFNIASQAFSTSARATPSVSTYQLTEPYLSGATLAYIQSLLASDVNMNLATFTSLDIGVVLNLTVSEVKNLLGANVADLKSYENQTLVRSWISTQFQSALNTLGIGLSGGKADPTNSTNTTTSSPSNNSTTTTTKSPSNNSTSTTTRSPSNNSTVTTTTSQTTSTTKSTTSSGSGSTSTTTSTSSTTGNAPPGPARANTGFSLLALLVLLITSQHIVI